jgi:hypothetical protein
MCVRHSPESHAAASPSLTLGVPCSGSVTEPGASATGRTTLRLSSPLVGRRPMEHSLAITVTRDRPRAGHARPLWAAGPWGTVGLAAQNRDREGADKDR